MRHSSLRRFKRLLLYKPERLVKRAYWYEQCRMQVQGKRLERWIARYGARPGSMLGECYGRACPNSRLLYPERRRWFVKQACYVVRQKWGSVIDQLRVVCVGSGSLLQEVILLTHICKMVHIKRCEVVLCDAEYNCHSHDEQVILQARLVQAQTIMSVLAPQIVWSWSLRSEFSRDSIETLIPTLVCAADLSRHVVLEHINTALYHDHLSAVVLDEEGAVSSSSLSLVDKR